MRITKYTTEIEDGLNILVKENSINYAGGNFTSPSSIVEMMNKLFHLDKKAEEYVYMIGFNTKMKPVGIFEISHGAVDCSIVNPREIYIRALLCGASSIILIHNHPSGESIRSNDDDTITRRVTEAGNLIGVSCLDHIIIGRDEYLSYKEKGFI